MKKQLRIILIIAAAALSLPSVSHAALPNNLDTSENYTVTDTTQLQTSIADPDGTPISSVTFAGDLFSHVDVANVQFLGGVFSGTSFEPFNISGDACQGSYLGYNITFADRGDVSVTSSTIGGIVYTTFTFAHPTSTPIGNCVNFALINNSTITGTYFVYGASTTSLALANPYYGATTSISPSGPAYTCFNNNCNAPMVTSINFVYPENGNTVAPFDNYLLGFSNLIATHTYQVKANWVLPQVTPVQNFVQSGNSAGFLTQFGLTIPWYNNTPITANGSTTWVANASLFDQTQCDLSMDAGVCATPVATSSITYDMLSWCNQLGCFGAGVTSTFNYVTSDGQGSSTSTPNPVLTGTTQAQLQQIASSSAYCLAPTDIFSIGSGIAYGGCVVSNFLFGTSQYTLSYLNTQWNAFQNTFPFSVVFGNVTIFEGALNNTSTAQNSLSVTLFTNTATNGSAINILSSSTLVNAFRSNRCDLTCAQNIKDTIFQWDIDLAWLIAAITSVAILLK